MNPAKPRILVVDDNEENRDMLSRRLERKDFAVTCADGGRTALQQIADGSFDLVILDIMMPGVSGLEVLRTVRQTRAAAQLPIIMATARADSEDVVAALELGANDYVTKPIDFPVLLARIQAQLRARVTTTVPAPAPPQTPTTPSDTGSSCEIHEGMVLADTYRIDARIGVGGFGTVFRARHLKLDRDVAIKTLHSSMANRPGILARFHREAISSSRVKHPNAVMVMDYGVSSEGVAYLVMELLVGVPLSVVLKRDGPMRPRRCAEILAPVGRLLEEVHAAGIIHRDIKPANIFLERLRGQREVVKVVDFGIAKLLDETTDDEAPLTMAGAIIGTPAYMAPERLRGELLDGRSDIYSLGVMLYEMSTGKLPFHSEQGPLAVAMMHLNDQPPPLLGVDPDFAALVADCLAKPPERRPAAGEFARRLESLTNSDRE